MLCQHGPLHIVLKPQYGSQCLLDQEVELSSWVEISLLTYYLRGVSGRRREAVSEMFTKDRLQGIAQKLDIAHRGPFDVGLTWLAPPDIILDLAEETVIIGRYSGTFPAFSSNSMPLTVQSQHHPFSVGQRGCGQLHPTHVQAKGASTV